MGRLLHIALLAVLLVAPPAVKADNPANTGETATAGKPATAEGATMLDSLLFRFHSYTTLCAPEKVYLHYDRSCYAAGETIWFKGWVQEASRHSGLPPSNFLYAEVLDGSGETLVRVKIKRTGGGFPGCIELPDNLESGDYTLRAYTLWQLNNPAGYLFNDRIRIQGKTEKKDKKPKASAPGVDISFWPEGGRYFSDNKAVIGFLATDSRGRRVDFRGDLVSDGDSMTMPVSTTHDGMGSFAFLPQTGHSYSLRDESGRLHPLPPPSEEGATLQLSFHAGRYFISAFGLGGGVASLLVRDLSDLRPLARISLNGKAGVLKKDKSFFRPGINHLLLVNPQGKILAERLFFLRDDGAPRCRLEMKQFAATPRTPVKGIISLRAPDGTPLDGTCSVSVVRGAFEDWQPSDGITSYFGLSSELKGRINRPDYYFDPDIPEEERDAALDILMMVQGWRYYDMEKIADRNGSRFTVRHPREVMQEIRGSVTRRLSSRMPKKFTFTVWIPKQDMLQSVNVEQGRTFIIDSLDFPENTEFLISIGTKRQLASYLPKWDGDPAAGPFLYQPAPGWGGRAETPLLHEAASDDSLKAAVITAAYEDIEPLINGRSYQRDLETYKDLTLVEYLAMTKAMFEYDGEHMYNRNWRKYASPHWEEVDITEGSGDSGEEDENERHGAVKLIVDGSVQPWWGYDMLRLEDIRSLSISTQTDPIYGGEGGVVWLSVKPGGLKRSEGRDPSLLYFVPLGYQTPRYFESPRYDRGDYRLSDKRNTLWWSPSVTIKEGRAPLSFWNSDRMDFPYIVRIEGLAADGRPFSRHCLISPAQSPADTR